MASLLIGANITLHLENNFKFILSLVIWYITAPRPLQSSSPQTQLLGMLTRWLSYVLSLTASFHGHDSVFQQAF